MKTKSRSDAKIPDTAAPDAKGLGMDRIRYDHTSARRSAQIEEYYEKRPTGKTSKTHRISSVKH